MGKTVFITGGSRGIGAACVRKFASEGWSVAFTYANQKDAAQELMKDFGESKVLPLKLSLPDDIVNIEGIMKEARTYFGVSAFDALVVNAGISKSGTLDRMDEASIGDLLDVNLKGAIFTVKSAIPEMIREKKGSIVLLSSIWGEKGASCESIYSASKAGIIGFGKSMAQELAPSGIRVNMVSPGVIDTDMNAGYSPDEKEELIRQTPLGKIGDPKEVANGVFFLASDDASFITGQNLLIDGGITM